MSSPKTRDDTLSKVSTPKLAAKIKQYEKTSLLLYSYLGIETIIIGIDGLVLAFNLKTINSLVTTG